ncbi:TadE family type IV pilus minor pilin [Streptomyces profundus]|uniref:TadE family type IV pilus minor pilin n=1 Tax=Streptomyces profundus TaxID=2867410 RepID=UPI001D1641E1|nr:TadE family type IV pilus minor pilin [Streptomyces sp. MA3_2.13]UED85522.1 pilus assembly protein [Streptomyces sp. MA3_2.13]
MPCATWSNGRSPRRSDRGYVTVETALAIPVLVLLLTVLLGALGAVAAQSRCQDGARAAARAAARGEPADVVLEAARRAAPGGARVRTTQEGDLHRVSVTAPALGTELLGFDVSGEAVARAEPR